MVLGLALVALARADTPPLHIDAMRHDAELRLFAALLDLSPEASMRSLILQSGRHV